MVSAVVLAAGESTRMGRPKPFLPLGGRSILARVLDAARGAHFDEIVVVLGHEADRVRREVPLDGTSVVLNPAYASGMSGSIRAGIQASNPSSRAYMIILGDQPFVSARTFDALIEAARASGAKIVVPSYRGERGNPVLLDASLAPEVETIAGDIGCRAIFGHHGGEILEVPVDDPGVLVDLDTPGQVAKAQEALERGEPIESLCEQLAAERFARPSDELHRSLRESVDVIAVAHDLRSRNEPFALATVVRVSRPTSGRPGFKAIVRPNREVIGWVGGSCAESVLLLESLASLRDGRPRLLRLSRDPGSGPAEEGVVEYVMECHSGGAMDIYIEPHLPKPQLLIVGPSPVAETLSSMGRLLGYRVVVVAPKARPEDFPAADRFASSLEEIPDLVTADTFAAVATMGKYDMSALRSLASSPSAYVGLVASRRRAEAVRKDLLQARLPTEAIERIRTPAGLDLGAETPEEIALSIMAEIVTVRRTSSPRTIPVAEPPATPAPAMMIDVVCGMEVDPDSPLRATHDGRLFVFCSEGCRTRFLESPPTFLE
jgi:xanthine dehydrogenase accessory factor